MTATTQSGRVLRTDNPRLSLSIPSSWLARPNAFAESSTPRSVIFVSSEALDPPPVPVPNGDWDAPVEDLSNAGAAVLVAVYDLRIPPEDWLTPSAVAALKQAGQWPWDPGSSSPPLHRLSGLVDLADATAANDERQHRVGAFRYQNFVVTIDVWFGPSADVSSVDHVVSTIGPG